MIKVLYEQSIKIPKNTYQVTLNKSNREFVVLDLGNIKSISYKTKSLHKLRLKPWKIVIILCDLRIIAYDASRLSSIWELNRNISTLFIAEKIPQKYKVIDAKN